MNRFTAVGLSALLFPALSFAGRGDPALEYARQIEGDGYVFVPMRGLQDGVVFYRKYDRTVGDSQSFSGLRQVVVSYTVNEATRLRVEAEVRAKGFQLARNPPRTKDGEFCKPSDEILALLGERAQQFPPKPVITASNAQLCFVSFVFNPDDEARVMKALRDETPVEPVGTIFSCSAKSVSYNPRRLFDRLEKTNAFMSAGDLLSADFWSFVYDTSSLGAKEPALLETQNPKEAVIDFMANARLDGQKISFSRSALPGPTVKCDPVDIEIKLN